jgi:ATP-dependent DNA helicase RecQ
VHIIRSIDRKVMLDDLAASKGLEMGQLFDELEAIVGSGTKISIEYFIKQVIDDDKVEAIYDYFHHHAQSDSLDEAMLFLGGDYTEEEVRLVRLKFMSDVAN